VLILGIIYKVSVVNINKMIFNENFTIGENDADDNQAFYNIKNIFLDQDSNIYVCDSGNSRVQVFDKNGGFLFSFGREGQGPGEFSSITAGVIYNNEFILILDDDQRKINIFDLKGKFVSSFTIAGKGSGLCVNSKNEILIPYVGKKGFVIHKYNIEGELTGSFGKVEEKYEQFSLFNNAYSICLDSDDNVFLCCRYFNELIKYDKNGDLIKTVEPKLPYEVAKPKFGKGISARSAYFDIAYFNNKVYVLTAPQGLIKNIFEISNEIIVFDDNLNQKSMSTLPYLVIAVNFNNDRNIILVDMDFIIHIGKMTL